MKRILFLLLFVFSIMVAAPSPAMPPVPLSVKDDIVFIYIPKEGQWVANGTGFFMKIVGPKPDKPAIYCITAKHVLVQPDGKSFFSKIRLRINTKDGMASSEDVELFPEGTRKNVFLHPEESVDIAVISVNLDSSKYPFDNFLTAQHIALPDYLKREYIWEGTEVFFAGLFTGYMGEQRNSPIFRFGKVALITDEKIDWAGKKMNLYLVESTSWGGNSGSPVFFYPQAESATGDLRIGTPSLKLAGVMMGFFGHLDPIRAVETAKVAMANSNIGISAVAPAYKLNDILFGEELRKHRGF